MVRPLASLKIRNIHGVPGEEMKRQQELLTDTLVSTDSGATEKLKIFEFPVDDRGISKVVYLVYNLDKKKIVTISLHPLIEGQRERRPEKMFFNDQIILGDRGPLNTLFGKDIVDDLRNVSRAEFTKNGEVKLFMGKKFSLALPKLQDLFSFLTKKKHS